jgi:hypothetical protein
LPAERDVYPVKTLVTARPRGPKISSNRTR